MKLRIKRTHISRASRLLRRRPDVAPRSCAVAQAVRERHGHKAVYVAGNMIFVNHRQRYSVEGVDSLQSVNRPQTILLTEISR